MNLCLNSNQLMLLRQGKWQIVATLAAIICRLDGLEAAKQLYSDYLARKQCLSQSKNSA